MSDPGQVTCSVCGTANPAAAPVCQNCGRALPGLADRLFAADSAAQSPVASPPPAAPAISPPPAPLPAPPPPPPLPPPGSTEAAEWQPPEDALATWTGAATPAVESGPPERPRSRTLLLLAAIVAVLVLAAGAFLLFGQGEDDADPDAAPSGTTTAPDATTTTAAPSTTSSTPVTPPAEPTNLAVAPANSTSLSMTWIDGADNEDRYVVARVRGDIVDQIADLPANSAGYVVDGLEPDTLYCFTVATTNAATGEPAFVPEACAVTDP